MSDHFFSLLEESLTGSKGLKDKNLLAAQAIKAQLFDRQRSLIDDESRFKSLLTPRRCGKSHALISYAFITALRKPGANIKIICLTLGAAKRIYWSLISQFGENYGLNLDRVGGLKAQDGIVTFENKSVIQLFGCKDMVEVEKQRGAANDLVLIDECKSFKPYILDNLIKDVIKPSLLDRRGTLVLCGTPGDLLYGPFYEATAPGLKKKNRLITRDYYNPEPHWLKEGNRKTWRWSRHHFTQEHNIFCPNLWEDALLEKATQGWSDDNPTWVREYLGKWVSTGSELVYSYSELLDRDSHLPVPRVHYISLPDLEWKYVLGLDLGFEDDTAIVVSAFSENSGSIYLAHEYSSAKLTIAEIAEKVFEAKLLFDNKISVMVADTGALGKTIVNELNKLYGFGFIPAEKQGKYSYISLLNSDMTRSRVKIPENSKLGYEWSNLTWDLGNSTKQALIKAGRLRENKAKANHLSDAFLYTWRYCYHHFSKPKKTIDTESPLYAKLLDDMAARKAEERIFGTKEKSIGISEDLIDEYTRAFFGHI